MMKWNVAGLALMLAMAAGAVAQDAKPIGATVRLGAFEPQSKVARDEGGRRWAAFGVDLNVRRLSVGSANPNYRAALGLSLDYAGGGDFSTIPITLNYIGSVDKWFYNAGLGLAINREQYEDGSEIETRTRVRFAFQVGVGYEFRNGQFPLLVQAKFLGTDFEDVNGFAVFVGTRL